MCSFVSGSYEASGGVSSAMLKHTLASDSKLYVSCCYGFGTEWSCGDPENHVLRVGERRFLREIIRLHSFAGM